MTPKPYPTPWRWVDLGLPSGTLWLDRNVGANSPEDVGLYFMWGQLTGGYKEPPGYDLQAHYDSLGLNRINSDLTIKNDVAAYYYGKKFRMPSADEVSELLNYTTYEQEGNSLRLVSTVNGKSILLPINGAIGSNEYFYADTVRCWTKAYVDSTRAKDLHGKEDLLILGSGTLRYRAMGVRPVYNR